MLQGETEFFVKIFYASHPFQKQKNDSLIIYSEMPLLEGREICCQWHFTEKGYQSKKGRKAASVLHKLCCVIADIRE